jgi:hypothetical protein
MQRKSIRHLLQAIFEKFSTQTTANEVGPNEQLIQYCVIEFDRRKPNNVAILLGNGHFPPCDSLLTNSPPKLF